MNEIDTQEYIASLNKQIDNLLEENARLKLENKRCEKWGYVLARECDAWSHERGCCVHSGNGFGHCAPENCPLIQE